MPHDVRDQVVNFVRRWSEKSEIGVGRFIAWLGVTASKFYDWRERYGRVNEHNGWVPRDFWLEMWEKVPPRHIARADQNDSRRKHERSFPPVRHHLPLNSRRVLAHHGGRLLTLLSVLLQSGCWR